MSYDHWKTQEQWYELPADHPPMADDPQSFQGDDGNEPDLSCPICGCTEAAWSGTLGNTFHWCCRNCGLTQYQEAE